MQTTNEIANTASIAQINVVITKMKAYGCPSYYLKQCAIDEWIAQIDAILQQHQLDVQPWHCLLGDYGWFETATYEAEMQAHPAEMHARAAQFDRTATWHFYHAEQPALNDEVDMLNRSVSGKLVMQVIQAAQAYRQMLAGQA